MTMFRCRPVCGVTKLFRMKRKIIRETRQVGEIINSVCMYNVYLMTVKPGYKVISPTALWLVLLLKVSI